MSTDTQNLGPITYCPGCGYPLDVGRCPECGLVSARENLDWSPLQTRRRRLRKRALVALLGIGVPALLGWYVLTRTNWPSGVPSSILLMIPHVQEGFPLDELWRRYSAERLTPRQADRLLKTSLEVPDHFLARQNYPCDSPSTVYAAFRLHAPEEWDVGIVLSELHVDGRRLNGPFEPLQSGSYPGRTRQWEPISNARIPALPPGRHTALLVLTVRLRPSDEDSPILLDPPEVEVRIPGDFVVQEKRLADFTKGIYTPELARQVADSISISLDRTPQGLRRQLVVTANGLWGVFGQFEIRAEGQERFQAISDYGLGSPSGELFSYWHAEDMNGPLPQTARIDLRLVPDPTYAFEVNAKEYFDGIIEWKDVPVHTGRPIEARWPTIDPHGQVKPTRVFPVHPNKVGQSFSR